MAFIPTLDSSRLLRKKFINPQSLAELAVEANVWRTAQDNRYVTRAEYVAGGSGIAPTIFDAKGDLIVGSANDTPLRLAVGTNGQTLVADSNQTPGLKWATRPALYTNLIRNPSVEIDTSDLAAGASGSTIARVTTEAYVGTASVRAVCDGTVADQGLVFYARSSVLTVGSPCRASVWVKAPAGTSLRLYLSGGDIDVTGSLVAFTGTGAWQRITSNAATYTAASDVAVVVSTASPQAVTFYADAALFVLGSRMPDYFDGDTAGCYWTGTAHASTSVRAALSATDGVARADLPVLTRNLVLNPSFELGTTGWGVVAGATITRTTSAAFVGVGRLQITTSSANPNSGAELTSRVRVTPGVTYTASVQVVGTAVATTFSVLFYDEAGVQVGTTVSSAFVNTQDFYTRRSVTTVAPTGAATMSVRATRDAAGTGLIFLDAVQIEAGTRATAYVDGDQKGCYWTGTPHASESVRMVRGEEGIAKLDLPLLARNLVRNPSFENTTPLAGWTLSDNGASSLTGTASTDRGHAGPTSIKLVNANAGEVDFAEYLLSGLTNGTTYTASAYLYVSTITGAAVQNRSINVVNAGGGADLASDTTLTTSHVTGQWVRKTVRFIPTDGGARIRLYSPQGTVYWDAVQVETGSAATAYVDGDQPGCAWDGSRADSTSYRYAPDRETAMLDRDLVGTGSPEGFIAAPVGTRYVDTDATVGARSWEKATGTGSTGWVATGSDTGDRLVASSITNLGDATLVARRVGSQVTVTLIQPTAGTATGTVSLTTLPVGFRPTRTGSIVAVPVVTQAGAIVTGAALAVTDAGVVTLTGATNATRHYAQVTYTTANAYPTTLPGTAA